MSNLVVRYSCQQGINFAGVEESAHICSQHCELMQRCHDYSFASLQLLRNQFLSGKFRDVIDCADIKLTDLERMLHLPLFTVLFI